MPHQDRNQVGCRPSLHLATVLIVSLATVSFLTSLTRPLAAQSKPAAGASAKKPTAQSATKAYEAGVKAFDKGKVKSAVTSLSAALRQGGLPPQKMAKALFYRGSAYRKQKKPAQAISDLTSAIWIKGGLSDGDRLAAIEQRKSAYKEAGLGTKVPQGLQPGASVPSTAVATAVPVAAPVAAPSTPLPAVTPQTSVTSAPSGAATSAWTTTAGPAPTPTKQVATVTPPAASASSPFSSLTPPITPTPPPSNTVSTLPRGGPAPAATAQPGTGIGSAVTNIGTTISNGVSGVGSFFGNMFSSNTTTPSAPPTGQATQIATSSTARAPQLSAAPQAQSSPVPAVTQGWTSATKSSQTAPAAKPRPVRTAALPTKAKPAPRSGKFRLQVAAVRSEAKAQQVVAALNSKYAKDLGGAKPEIDAAAIGNMGTFYRVRVGPYADTKAPRGLCARLKPDGFDCLIVTP